MNTTLGQASLTSTALLVSKLEEANRLRGTQDQYKLLTSTGRAPATTLAYKAEVTNTHSHNHVALFLILG